MKNVDLKEFSRCLAVLGAKLSNQKDSHDVIQFSLGAIQTENNLHKDYLVDLTNDKTDTQASPSCFAYSNYLLATTLLEPVEISLAALLPCFWIYHELGCYISERLQDDNPFQQWIDLYGGHNFAKATERFIALVDQHALNASTSTQGKMRDAFIIAAKYEWLFWHSAYHGEKWLI